ncbi:MAG: helix-turn-helix transcriptional regulator [Fibrobacteria bacterium]|nr:helix-turn-helix transcriptional regulator [Fibrobacteria bacterium]
MLAVVKTPHTDIKIKGFVSNKVLAVLKGEFGKALKIKREKSDEELVDLFETNLYKSFKKRITPGDYVKTYRENLELTQAALGERVDMTRAYICDLEKNRRPISKEMAKKLAKIFGVSVSCFIS